MENTPLDILIYAHDGRGLGHASRSITIGMALRRLYPELRVLFVSGCKSSQELIGPALLDWLKLPSYKTEVVGGKSRGVTGHSMFSDHELAELRAAQLQQIVALYQPRLVLCDHTPQGKHRELVPAIKSSGSQKTRWILGVRGVVGAVPQARSELARTLFADHYQALFWYGDESVLGYSHQQLLQEQYGVGPIACGYVSRMRELQHLQRKNAGRYLAGTIAIPWLGEHSLAFLNVLADALKQLGPSSGTWRLFVDMDDSAATSLEVQRLFAPLNYCQLEPLSGSRYIEALLASHSALIYGGYNSLMDVLAVNLPAVVVQREMQDNEQQIHLEKLKGILGTRLSSVQETAIDAAELHNALVKNLGQGQEECHNVQLDGGEKAATLLWQMLHEGSHG